MQDSRVILVTAANGELGDAIARTFLEKDPSTMVWLGIHRRRERVDALVEAHADRCFVVELDVTREEAWKRVVEEVVGKHERLDVLVNNAGGHEDALLAQMPHESWSRVLALNLDSAFLGCQTVLPTMISQRFGRIVNIASLSALLAPAGQANYAAAKAGLVGMTQSLSKEVARIGITVNAVCPGYIDTEALDDMDAEARKAARARIPMRRFGRPGEVGALVEFLAGAEAGYITGAAIKIDGGIL